MGYFKQRRVLLIGGTGTIGQGLLRAILEQEPKVVRVFSRDEFKQFELQMEMRGFSNVRYLLGDVRDYTRLQRAMEGIDVVFHTAALKHVPACEYNPFEAVRTNIIGTQNVITAAIQAKVKKVIVTSTDKAISPTNTYGATKLVVERLVAAADFSKGSAKTVFAAVRFGNVMGSRGSIIPLIKRQMLDGKPVTITDSEMSRFMMTQSQAVGLTMTAAERAQGGELFILKMPVIRLGDLFETVQEEVSRKYGVPVQPVETIGLRSGEKMYEELMTEDESHQALEFEDMFLIPPQRATDTSQIWEAAPAKVGSYSSSAVAPIGKERLRDWLLTENLI